jgi:hypothetical protein
VDAACSLAEAAFNPYRAAGLEARARLLETIAQGILDLGDVLVERVMSESGLPRGRVEGERGRTVGQLRLFASLAREGRWLNATIDRAMPERKPMPRADLRSQKIPLGPVAVFSASNFPLAFSVAGGDTAAALAAGCPVVAKSHSSHLGTSELVGRVVQKAVRIAGIAGGRVFAAGGRREHGGRGVGEASGDPGGRVYGIAARGAHAGCGGCGARGSDPGVRGDEQHQSGVPAAGGAGGTGGEDCAGADRFGDAGYGAVLHQAGDCDRCCGGGL